MKNPGFLTNGTIVVLKPSKSLGKEINNIAVVIGRYEKVVEGQPEFVALPIVLNPDDEDQISAYLTQNKIMSSYFSVFEDEIVSTVGIVKDIDKSEWLITHTINYLIDQENGTKDSVHVTKLEETLESAVEEKNFIKFKWIINNTQFDQYTLREWIGKLHSNKDFYTEFFDIKEKDIDVCLSKLEKQLEELR